MLLALALGHIFVMHYQNAPTATDAAFVLPRWSAVGWRLFDGALLLLALTHGAVGTVGVVRERFARTRARSAAVVTLTALTGGLVIVGLEALLDAGRPWFAPPSVALLARALGATLQSSLVTLATLTYAAAGGLLVACGVNLARGVPLGRWLFAGQWAWALQRSSGVGVFAFLAIHIADVALLPLAPAVYDATVASYASPYLIPMEIALVGALVYHSLNGTRLIVLEWLERRAVAGRVPSFAAVLALTVVLVVPSVLVLLKTMR